MSATFKRILSFTTALLLALTCALGLGNNVSDDYKEYKNVILMIGDGMGENTLAVTRQKYNTSLFMDSMPVHGNSDTRSFIFDYTDSAAGGTALACGIRVWINSVARFAFHPFTIDDTSVPISLTELAKNNGKSAGVVTTDKTSGATPSAFSAHAISRTLEREISKDQLSGNLDLIWGADTAPVTEEKCAKYGFDYISTKTELDALEEGSRSFAQFDFGDLKNCENEKDTPSITEMTEKAIDLLDDNEKGFFLMVEGACIDKFSHDNDFDGATKCVMAFDDAVKAAVEYAKEDGETLVVVTADHETGGIKYNAEKDEYYYTRTDHSTADVPLFVSESDAGFTDGQLVENRQISVQIARVMGFDETQFPAVKPYSGDPVITK